MHRYMARSKRGHVVRELPFFVKASAVTHARRMGGWVTDGEGRIIADFRPRWRQRLALFLTVLRLRWWRYRRCQG